MRLLLCLMIAALFLMPIACGDDDDDDNDSSADDDTDDDDNDDTSTDDDDDDNDDDTGPTEYLVLDSGTRRIGGFAVNAAGEIYLLRFNRSIVKLVSP